MAQEITTGKEGSFARYTILNRVPDILKDLISGNDLSREAEKGLGELSNSLPGGELSLLDGDYPFSGTINLTLQEHPDYLWLNAPFLFLENYLYHRISEICGYFTNRFDYFRYKKEAEAVKGRDRFAAFLGNRDSLDTFSEICLLNLMGNKADLSQNASHYSPDGVSELLIDHRDRAATLIGRASRVDLILDNAGEELFFDLLLAYWLLSRTDVHRVKLHFKSMPYFVSDALVADYRFLLNLLAGEKETGWFAGEMNRLEGEGRLELGEDPFFVSGEPYSRLPRTLSEELTRSDLLLFKGDLNYRRLVGDCYWPHGTETSSLVKGFSTDILISRILKSEVMAGLEPGSIPSRIRTDWMFSGKYGQIELVPGSGT